MIPGTLAQSQLVPAELPPEMRESVAFIIRLAEALHKYGTPAHRLEDALQRCAQRLGLEGQFFSTPTAMIAAFGIGADQRTYCLRFEPGEVDLERVVALDAVLEAVIAGSLEPDDATDRLDQIIAAPPRYGGKLTTIAFALVAGSAARFFGAGPLEITLAAGIGLLIGVLAVVAQRRRDLVRLLEFAAGLVAAFVATAGAKLVGPLASYTVMVGSLIVLLPGLTLTTAINELSTRNLVSGAARLVNALMIFVAIGFGVALGRQLGLMIAPNPDGEAVRMALWTEPVALIIGSVAFTILFRAAPRDVWLLIVSGVVAFYSARLGSLGLGPQLGVCIGAMVVGAGSNLYAHAANRPAALTMLPGIMMLVPGGIGFTGLTALLERDVVSGIETGFEMFLIAGGLVAGLLVAQVAVPSRKAL